MTGTLQQFVVLVALSTLACEVVSKSSDNDGGNWANQCTKDSECLEGHCVDGACVAVSSALDTVAVEIIAPAAMSSGEYQQLRYLQLVELSNSGTFDIALDSTAALTIVAKPPTDACAPKSVDSSGNVPVSVEVLQDPRVNGITASSYVGASNPADDDNQVRIHVPPGLAAIYIEPLSDIEVTDGVPDDCTIVPLLALGRSILSGNGSLEQRMPIAKHLDLDVSIPVDKNGSSPLQGYVVDVVEPLLGRRLSTQVTLAAPVVENGTAHHTVTLAYQPVIGEGESDLLGRELFRLTPPSTRVSPTFYVSRLAVDLFGTDELVVNHVNHVPTEVAVEGQVESETGSIPLASQVTAILRNSSDLSTGAIAQFRASATSDEHGRFHLSLVAGDYDVVVTPQFDTLYATAVTQWTIAPTPTNQAGKLVTLPQMAKLSGLVRGATEQAGSWAANVLAVPSTIGQNNTFIDTLVGRTRTVGRRSATGPVALDGAFELAVDPGNYDISVRPNEGAGYPWAVLPNTVVADSGIGLGAVQISAPFAFTGYVTVPGTEISRERVVLPGALLRTYALFDVNGQLVNEWDSATAAVQIGEARASSLGQYELLLPASLE